MTKLYKHSKEPEVYYYFNANGEKLWMFRHRYYDSSGKRREKRKSGFKTDKAAIKALMEVKALTLRGDTKKLDYEYITVGQWLDTWFEANYIKLAPTTQRTYKNAINNYLKPTIGQYKLQKLDKATYQREFINKFVGKFKPRTIRLWHNVFSVAINAAVEEEILPRNRFTRVSIPDEDNDVVKDNYLTENELNQLLDFAKQHEPITNYTALLVLAYTGMRKGELMGLQWKNIDFKYNTITIEHTRDRLGLRKPKTRNSYRTIPVDPSVMEQLKRYKTWCKQLLLKHGKKIKADSIVFIDECAEPIYSEFINYVLKLVIKASGIKEITVHGLRHTHATILLNRNANVKAIAERLGNTPDMIYRIYGHLTKDSSNALMSVFSDSLSASGVKTGVQD